MIAALAYSSLGDHGAALPHFEECTRAEPEEAAHWHNLGRCMIRAGTSGSGPVPRGRTDWGTALRHLERAVELSKDGVVAREARREMSAVRHVIALEIKDKGGGMSIETWLVLEREFSEGLGLTRDGRLPEAEARFRRVAELDQSSHKAFGNLGLVLMLQGKLDEAEEALRRSLELQGDYPPALSNLARLRKLRMMPADRLARELDGSRHSLTFQLF
jgi:tetratricopeptide (TPR) repeat protein